MDKYTREQIIQRRNYDKQISGDPLSLYLSNFADQAHYLSTRIGNPRKSAIELCCGIGITLAELAKVFQTVTGIELDSAVAEGCLKNLKRWGIHNANVVIGDIAGAGFVQSLKADIAIYDIPYWGIGLTAFGYDHKSPNLRQIVELLREFVTRDIVVFAPPHFSYQQARAELGDCEYEKIFRDTKHDRNYIYLGELAQTHAITQKIFEGKQF